MAATALIKPTHKAIKQYHQALKDYREQGVTHEGALETAFQRLLTDTAKLHHCTLIPKQKLRVGKNNIFPDGTVRETLYDTRLGFWEAKDTDDDLDKEIAAKIAKGYPLSNTIFEDTRRAVLFQGGIERYRFNLADKKELADLLNEFYAYHEPVIETFQEAVEEFKDHVPQLAKGLVGKLDEAHKSNKKFQAAFESFFTICQRTLNPNISRAAVDEMLVQHLLTERLIRKIFDNPEFMHRNVIAAEIEKVIDALVSLSFNRDQFLKSLDRFYRAIEDAAHTLEDFAEKQHFLNTIYERFFQGYSVKVADTHGIVYTPQEIVDFMCASVAEVLETEFGMTLGSKGVNILDPCTGTGNFIVNLIGRIPKKDLPRVYKEQLFANEVMLLPYYIAALNIEHAYWERTGEYQAFEGLCYVDTLELTEGEGNQPLFEYMNEQNTARVARQKTTPITVIIGNPPYNVGQLNANDNNKNRKYPVVEKRIQETFAKDSTATNRKALSDAYVKFFRWGIDRLQGRDGVICFISNNSFIDQIAFDGMRKRLFEDFTCLYHMHLEGNVRHNPTLSGTAYNVFGIQVGVGITVAVKSSIHREKKLLFHRIDKCMRKEAKLAWLQEKISIAGVKWQQLKPDARNLWLKIENTESFTSFTPLGGHEQGERGTANEERIFQTYGRGLETNRDDWVYGFNDAELEGRIENLIDTYNGEVDRWKRRSKNDNVDDFVISDESKIKWSSRLKDTLVRGVYAHYDKAKLRKASYRPFTRQFIFFDAVLNQRQSIFKQVFPTAIAENDNLVLILTDLGSEKPFLVQVANSIPDLHYVGAGAASKCFPFYTYDEDGTNRRENITDWALQQFRTHYGDDTIGKWDIFYFVYGLLHHPGYRTKFADNLKRELPRIPFAPDFRAFAAAGKELATLHLDYEKLEPYPLKWIETEGVPLSYKVEDKMRLTKDKTALRVNPSLTLGGIPPETFQYRLGNRSALDWVIDQYQIYEDKRSGIRSDPNREDDKEYIVRLVGQVVRVSVETVRTVNGLPEEYSPLTIGNDLA